MHFKMPHSNCNCDELVAGDLVPRTVYLITFFTYNTDSLIVLPLA